MAYATDPHAEFVRDALISRFTFAFAQTATTLGRYLDIVYCLPDARTLSPRQAIRHAARLHLIDNCEAWLRHVENRNRVAHAYLESLAVMVANGSADFAADARALLTPWIMGDLDEDFDESNLPIIVELHDIALTDARFLERVRKDFLILD